LKPKLCCESNSEERSAGNPHATFCGGWSAGSSDLLLPDSTIINDERVSQKQCRTAVMDISARKKTEEKMRQFKSIVSSSFDMIALIDTNFVYLATNKAYLDAMGKSRQEIVGNSVSKIFGKKFFEKGIKPHAERCMEGQNVRFNDWFEFPVLGHRYMSVQYSPYLSRSNKIKGFVVNARDMTQLKQSQVLLEKNRLQLETVLNNIDSSIYITDMKSNEILFINKHMKKFFKKDLTGDICWKSIHENQTGPCEFCTNEKLIDSSGNPAKPYVWEFYNQKLDKWYELHDAAIRWMDGNLARLEIATDITQRKIMEEKQKKNKIILEEKVKKRTADLEDMNSALKVLLKKREEDKEEIEEKIFANHKLVLLPIIENIKKGITQKTQYDLINILELELKNIISPFSKKLSDKMINLTPTEIHVANLIKLGKSNKEISTILNNSVHTISRHRGNIRKKTGLKNQKINLRSFLLTLQ